MSEQTTWDYETVRSLYFQKGKAAQAIQAYRAYLQLNPTHAAAWHELAVLLHAQKDHCSAHQAITQALEFAPDEVDHWECLKRILEELNYAQNPAFTHYAPFKDTYLRLFADLQQLRLRLLEVYQRCIRLNPDPDLLAYWQRIGHILRELQDYPRALEAYRTALEQSHEADDLATCAMYLGLTYEALQDYPAALHWLEHSLALENSSGVRRHHQRVLQMIQARPAS